MFFAVSQNIRKFILVSLYLISDILDLEVRKRLYSKFFFLHAFTRPLVIQGLCFRFFGGDPGLTGKLLLKVSEKLFTNL